MKIKQSVLQHDLKEILYKQFIIDSRNQLVSVYKQRVDMNEAGGNWGGCWSGLSEDTSYQDVEDLVREVG